MRRTVTYGKTRCEFGKLGHYLSTLLLPCAQPDTVGHRYQSSSESPAWVFRCLHIIGHLTTTLLQSEESNIRPPYPFNGLALPLNACTYIAKLLDILAELTIYLRWHQSCGLLPKDVCFAQQQALVLVIQLAELRWMAIRKYTIDVAQLAEHLALLT
jgi:hypothetical protein